MKISFTLTILFILSFCSCTINTYGQSKSQTDRPLDSGKVKKGGFMSRMQDFAEKSAKESIEDFKSDKVAMVQLEVINQLRLTVQDAKGYLKTGLDTTLIKKKLKALKQDYLSGIEGVLTNRGTTQTYRNLASTKRVLKALSMEVKRIKSSLESQQKKFAYFHYKIDSLGTAPELFIFPKDSAQTLDYVRTLGSIAVDAAPVDSVLKASNARVQKLLYSYNMELSELQNTIEQVEGFEEQMANETFTRELPNIWQEQLRFRPFGEIVRFSLKKNIMTLKFYMVNNVGKISLIVLLCFCSFIYLNALRGIYKEKGLVSKEMNGQLAIRYPALSAILIVLSLFQFLLVSPPFTLSFIIWVISCSSLTVIFRNFITSYWMRVWLVMVLFFIIASASNLLLQASRAERWYMIVLAGIGVVAGTVIILHRKQVELREKWITYSIFVMVCIEFFSIILNIYGRFNLAKTLFLAGFLNVIIAILFLWVVRLINEGLLLAFEVYTVQNKKLFYLNFGKVGSQAPPVLYALLVLGWIVIMGHNFPLFELLSKPALDFLSAERRLGDYGFSINGILLFFLIMTISVVLSKIVSFFTSDDHLTGSKDNDQNNRGLGSWVLLLRIAILSIGLFLAIAAAGIPMERITIIIGALGVGVGFGLQTLVNNLVSGLIIAFEKPVNVGDIVDVDGQGGTMKSIGFRSSVISTWEGGDLVMPNGDLLNSHLMNWSLSGNRRRLSMEIGIAYDTDLKKCREIIHQILENEERVLKNPKPAVNFELFGSNAIELKIQLWTRHLKENNPTRNDLIIAINDAFAKNGIKIPFNQQDVHIHYPKNEPDQDSKRSGD